MVNINISQAQRMSAPCPFALLGTKSAEGTANFMAVSWWTYLSNHPPMLGVCLSNKGYSGGVIKEQKEFSLCLVGEQMRAAALECGRCSGRTVDKIQRFGIETMPASVIGAPLVSNSRVCFECRLTDALAVGDHTFFAAEIVAVHGDDTTPQLFAFDGYSRLGTI